MSDYNVTQIIGTWPAQYGKNRVAFKTEQTGDRSISAFAQAGEIEVGKKISGEITEKQVNGKTYYNFSFPKKEGSAGSGQSSEVLSVLNLKVVPLLNEILGRLPKQKDAFDYPDFNESNDGNGI